MRPFLFRSQVPASVPCAISVSPKDVVRLPRTLLTETYLNLIQYTDLKHGGHYSVLEQPVPIYKDFMEFFNKAQAFHAAQMEEKAN